MTYTKGKWEAVRNGISLYVEADKAKTSKDRRGKIAKVYGINEANAKLIASAPELLEALKSAYIVLDKLGDSSLEEILTSYDLIRQAIKKAEG